MSKPTLFFQDESIAVEWRPALLKVKGASMRRKKPPFALETIEGTIFWAMLLIVMIAALSILISSLTHTPWSMVFPPLFGGLIWLQRWLKRLSIPESGTTPHTRLGTVQPDSVKKIEFRSTDRADMQKQSEAKRPRR